MTIQSYTNGKPPNGPIDIKKVQLRTRGSDAHQPTPWLRPITGGVMAMQLEVHVKPVGLGKFEARLKCGRLLVASSKTPYFAAARLLQEEGVDHDTRLALITEGGLLSMFMPLGKAAKLTVVENER